ncbi:hypothetical protein B0T17DRAFT_171256 [Bombardia bombarda]|uniref:Uncharacterized protein n=1 Tax=Bombardia bombarda TaxID=252184 RepID=A0AA39X854_9PEZI|nr:hypothetical protein B0T17DRAFT_171256 [Bombardia bombarda]
MRLAFLINLQMETSTFLPSGFYLGKSNAYTVSNATFLTTMSLPSTTAPECRSRNPLPMPGQPALSSHISPVPTITYLNNRHGYRDPYMSVYKKVPVHIYRHTYIHTCTHACNQTSRDISPSYPFADR